MPKNHDSYLQAAEGFLHAVRDDIDQLDLRMDDCLKIAEVYALVSIARSLTGLVGVASASAQRQEAADDRATPMDAPVDAEEVGSRP